MRARCFSLFVSAFPSRLAPRIWIHIRRSRPVRADKRACSAFGARHGHIYIDLTTDQLDKDFLETIVPGNGLGGSFLVWGNTDHLPAMLVRFERADDKIAIVWPNTSFVGSRAVLTNFPQSVVGAGKIVAEGNGHIVFDASPLYKDVLDLDHIINTTLQTKQFTAYRLDHGRTYFGAIKDFPQNTSSFTSSSSGRRASRTFSRTPLRTRARCRWTSCTTLRSFRPTRTRRATPTIVSASTMTSTWILRRARISRSIGVCAISSGGTSRRRSHETIAVDPSDDLLFEQHDPAAFSQTYTRRGPEMERALSSGSEFSMQSK